MHLIYSYHYYNYLFRILIYLCFINNPSMYYKTIYVNNTKYIYIYIYSERIQIINIREIRVNGYSSPIKIFTMGLINILCDSNC